MSHLTGTKVAIVVTDYFEEAELTSPREALQQAGAEVHVIAPHDGEVQGLEHVDPGSPVTVDLTLDQADPNDYDAVVIPGGVVNADNLRMDLKARDFVMKMEGEGKPVAAICHGPWLLVSSGLVRGRKLTSYHTLQDDIRNAGGEWDDQELIVDGNLITSRKPDDLPAFNEAIINALEAK
jgi:protease I